MILMEDNILDLKEKAILLNKELNKKDKKIDRLTDESTEWESKCYDLQNRIDKASKYNEHLIRDAKYHLNLGHLKKMKKILQGSGKE